MLTIAWQYLTGNYYASSFNAREKPEWPVHPDRVFQALVAAWADRGKVEDERRALSWLEQLSPPKLYIPPNARPVDVPIAYVPVNDINASPMQRKNARYGDKLYELLPAMRPRKERYFPFVHVGDDISAMIWEDANLEEHETALKNLCCAVTRIGHSASLVRCWISETLFDPNYVPTQAGETRDFRLRVPQRGRLQTLCNVYEKSCETRVVQYAPTARQIGYREVVKTEEIGHGHFNSDLLIFAQQEGNIFDLRQTLSLTNALRGAILKGAEELGESGSAAKAIISGHESDGSYMKRPHLAFIPLAYVGSKYADGHILGLGLALPFGISREEEQLIYASLARKMKENGTLNLYLGKKGEAVFGYAASPLQRALRQETWTMPANVWASVTPIVMNQAIKKKDDDLYTWAAEQIRLSCEHQRLPQPSSVKISPVPFLSGSFPCYMTNSPHTGFFPRYESRQGMRPFMFHTKLVFSTKIVGPLLLGAGRYHGYGLCKPME